MTNSLRICMLALAVLPAMFCDVVAQEPRPSATEPSRKPVKVSELIADLSGGKLLERWNAAFRLGQMGSAASPATPALIKALRDKDVRVVWYSIHALGHIGPDAKAALPALHEALLADSDEGHPENPRYVAPAALGDKYTQRFAARAIGRIGVGADSIAPDLRRAMQSKDASLRVAAALALWQVAKDPAAITVISKMLAAEDVNAAHEAALAMAQLGSAGRPAIDDLVRALESGTEDVRRSAARALGQLGPIATSALTEALDSSNAAVRRAAAQGFGWLGQIVSEKVLHNNQVKDSIFVTVYDRLNSSAAAALRVALADQDPDVRRLSAEAMGTIGPVAVPTLIKAINEPDADLRRAAALALERVESRSPLADISDARASHFRKAISPSLVAAVSSKDPVVRLYAVRMIASLGVGPFAGEARPQLMRLLKDDSVQVRRYAFAALRQIRESQSPETDKSPATLPGEDR